MVPLAVKVYFCQQLRSRDPDTFNLQRFLVTQVPFYDPSTFSIFCNLQQKVLKGGWKLKLRPRLNFVLVRRPGFVPDCTQKLTWLSRHRTIVHNHILSLQRGKSDDKRRTMMNERKYITLVSGPLSQLARLAEHHVSTGIKGTVVVLMHLRKNSESKGCTKIIFPFTFVLDSSHRRRVNCKTRVAVNNRVHVPQSIFCGREE